MLNLIINLYKLLVVLFFYLIRYGFVIIIVAMYYKTLRSRIMCENKILNRKFFYIDFDINNYLDKNKLNEFAGIKTKENIQLDEKQLNELNQYLKKKNLNIENFKFFEGFVRLIMFEGFDKNLNQFLRGVYIYFFNKLNDNKYIIMIQNEFDVNMILIFLKSFFIETIIVALNNDFFSFIIPEDLNKNFLFIETIIYYLKKLIEYFEFYIKLLDEIKIFYSDFDNKHNVKNFVCAKSKNNENIENLDIFEKYSDKDYFLDFRGYIYLVEIEFKFDNKITKRYVIIFVNLIDNIIEYKIFFLFTKININFIIYILEFILIENNIEVNNVKLEEEILNFDFLKKYNEFKQTKDFFLLNGNIRQLSNKVIINDINIINIINMKNLIFFLKSYGLFFFNIDEK